MKVGLWPWCRIQIFEDVVRETTLEFLFQLFSLCWSEVGATIDSVDRAIEQLVVERVVVREPIQVKIPCSWRNNFPRQCNNFAKNYICVSHTLISNYIFGLSCTIVPLTNVSPHRTPPLGKVYKRGLQEAPAQLSSLVINSISYPIPSVSPLLPYFL